MSVKIGLRYIDIWKDSLEDAVLAYEREPLQKGQIVFYGPSHFTRWSEKYGMKPPFGSAFLVPAGSPVRSTGALAPVVPSISSIIIPV